MIPRGWRCGHTRSSAHPLQRLAGKPTSRRGVRGLAGSVAQALQVRPGAGRRTTGRRAFRLTGLSIAGAVIARKNIACKCATTEMCADFASRLKLWPQRDMGPNLSPMSWWMRSTTSCVGLGRREWPGATE